MTEANESVWTWTHPYVSAGSIEDVTTLQARYDACVKARDALQQQVVVLLAERDRLAQTLNDRDPER